MPNAAPLLLLLIASAAAVGCQDRAPVAATCSVSPSVALSVAGRADGIYGVIEETVGERPLIRFEELALRSSGIDAASKKHWLRLHVGDAAAGALAEFTAVRDARSIVVVVGAEVAAHHKIRQSITGNDFQVSCCNPRACERWTKRLGAGTAVAAPSSPAK
jgi:hypothetical protein